MGIKKTNEEFTKEIHALVNDEYIFLDEYKNAKTKILVKHNSEKCNSHKYYTSPNNFLKGNRCPKCYEGKRGEKRKKTNDEFVKEVYELVGNEYKLLEEYKGVKEKIKVKHNICGHNYMVSPDNLLRGRRCPRCAGLEKKTDEQFLREVYSLSRDEYMFQEEYNGNHNKIKCRHNKCGLNYRVSPANFLRGYGCPICNGNVKKNNQEFTKEIYELVSNEYFFLEEYINDATKIKCLHTTCGFMYQTSPNNFLQGKRCPKCNESKGEKEVAKILSKYNIAFIPQYKFENCRNIRPLPFDFYLDDSKVCIEFDGKQHFGGVKGWGGIEKFEKTQTNDQIKNDYCYNNNIPLLRIPYWESENIEHILFDFLVEHGALEEITV